MVAVVAVVLLAGVAPGADSATHCPVTIPTRSVPPDAGQSAAGFNYGGARLRAHLYWPRGTLPAGRLPDGGSYAAVMENGTIWVKIGWWRGIQGRLVVTGRRLDAPAPSIRVRARDGYGSTGFVPVGLTFPTVGCWRVQGTLGSARLTFVVRVTKLPPPG